MTDNEEITDGIKNITTFLRILPLVEISESFVKIEPDSKIVHVRSPRDMRLDRVKKSKDPIYRHFSMDGIFYNSSQEEVYEKAAKDLVKKVLEGVNCVLMSVGQTGSGKSFTIAGLRSNWEHKGIVTRLLSDMFAERRGNHKIQYRLSFVEIFGNEMKDLLSPCNDKTIKCNERGPLKGITTALVQNEEQALRYIFEGEARRRVIKGSSYPASHLGTAVITLHVINTSPITSWAVVTNSKIHVVDMAGIDTAGKPNCIKAASDVATANLMKSQLEQFFLCHAANNVPPCSIVRSSALLKYLGNTLNVTSILRFIAHISVTRENLEITLSTLRFLDTIGKLKPIRIEYKIEPETSMILRKLRDEVNALTMELDINTFFYEEALQNISTSRVEQIQRDALDFLNGTLSDITFDSISQAQILLKTFKDLYKKMDAERNKALQDIEIYQKALNDKVPSSAKSNNSKSGKIMASGSVTSTSNNKKSGRKSVERFTSKVLNQSEETAKEKVGDISTLAITPGPGLPEKSEGDAIAKSMKMIESGYNLNEERLLSTEPDIPEIPSISMISQKIPSREEAFKCFFNENNDANILKEVLNKTEQDLINAQETLVATAENHSHIANQLEATRVELMKQQNIRYLNREESYDEEGRILTSELERDLVKLTINLKNTLSRLQMDICTVKEELRTLTESHLDARSKLEAAFQEFCEKTYHQAIPQLENDLSEKRVIPENESSVEDMKHKFEEMQQMLTHA